MTFLFAFHSINFVWCLKLICIHLYFVENCFLTQLHTLLQDVLIIKLRN